MVVEDFMETLPMDVQQRSARLVRSATLLRCHRYAFSIGDQASAARCAESADPAGAEGYKHRLWA
jgi:hypothetical protein